ncbi:DUF87 domain-containing protein [Acidianus sulfidivorans JP7]|uniref:Helicase HerA central domain-containing protein n=1 Tax=Acidianus sulfidivorans JP7 TaxID=619593 RepID=A0A2U9IMD4_9CREN|nr:ATP-binding protein [Acidianus sulfidivorans]AWR97186.1 DUF87 domain-containing protein [Acidianus sulfidivorans JP7]
MQDVRHIIFYTLMVIIAFIAKYYFYHPNSLYYDVLGSLFLIFVIFTSAIISYILFSSVIISLSYLFPIVIIYDFFGFEILSFTYIASYLAGDIISFFFISLIRRRIEESFISQLSSINLKINYKQVLIDTIIFFFFILVNLLIIHSIFLFLGGLFSFLVLLFVNQIEFSPLIFLSWLSFPYLLSQLGTNDKRSGIYIGNTIGVLKRTIVNSSKINTNSTYKWVSSRSKFFLDLYNNKNFNLIILGTSGSGKSHLAKNIVSNSGVGFLVLDIHGEYNIDGAEIIDASKISINPLSLFGQSPRQRALEVAYMIRSLFNLGNLQTIDLYNLILEAYEDKGIFEDDESSWSNKPPNFRDVLLLIEKKKRLVNAIQEINRLESISPYISFLVSNTFMETSINIFDMLKKNIIINFSKVTVPEIKYVIIESLLYSIQSFMYLTGQSSLRKLIVIDEAPFILSKDSGEQLVERLFAEGRKFGFGFVIISQTAEYVKKLISNSSYVLVLSMVEPNDIEYISKLLGGQDMEIYKAIYNTLQKLDRGLIITRDILRNEIILVRSN